MATKKNHPGTTGPEIQNTALADLLKAKGFAPEAEPEKPAAAPKVAKAPFDLTRAEKIILRREKKGRGGKTVTIVSGLNLPANQLDELAKAMRKGLGCGAVTESGTVVLQGDIQERADKWLREHGAKKIVRGN
ncbi:MAG: translation initiation factor [Armatimonadota bacterium]